MRALWLSLTMLLVAGAAFAAPVDPALQKELLAVYDAFNATIAKGQYDKAVAQRPAEARAQFKSQLKTAQDRKAFVEMSKLMTPDSVEITYSRLSANGNKAVLVGTAAKIVPKGLKDPAAPPPGTVISSELTLEFVREDGKWKYLSQSFGMDPTRIKACNDTGFEPIESYDTARSLSAGGPIVRVDFKADHTLVVFRVLDEENCAFLPSREVLTKGGFDVGLLQPYAIVSIEGFRHKSSGQKIWVDQLDVSED